MFSVYEWSTMPPRGKNKDKGQIVLEKVTRVNDKGQEIALLHYFYFILLFTSHFPTSPPVTKNTHCSFCKL